MMMRGLFRELLPVGVQDVRVRLPEGTRAGWVWLLMAWKTPCVVEEEGVSVVTVPEVVDFEVIAIDFA